MNEKPNFRLDNILAETGQNLGALEPRILASLQIRPKNTALKEDRTFCLTKQSCDCDDYCACNPQCDCYTDPFKCSCDGYSGGGFP